jgi:predicted CXXCH cytochrome family protein
LSSEALLVAAVFVAGSLLLLEGRPDRRTLSLWSVLALVALGGFVGQRRRLAAATERTAVLTSAAPQRGRDGGYVSSDACRACHPEQHATWHRSYHRTMTQLATPEAVVAPFDGVTLEAHGRTYHLSSEGGAYFVEMVDPWWERAQARRGVDPLAVEHPPRLRARVVMTTGSHAMQTYWVAGGWGREAHNVPFVWNIATREWLPREDVFLRDPDSGPLRQTWNDNCSQCHSTGPQPRLSREGVDTRVGELGIACEACHGPGAEHIEANRNLVRRYRLHLTGEADPTIVNPARLPAPRAGEVCGQCHSKSLINDAKAWYTGEGLAFRPGDDLSVTRTPVLPRSAPDHPFVKQAAAADPEFFDLFFWKDGMIRVSGREWTGMVESACNSGGQLSCLSCHELHGRDPDMQLKPDMRSAAACVGCHPSYVDEATATRHARHAAGSPGSNCLDCHMPYTSYGLLRGLRSHLIDAPTVQASLTTGRPNACNLCHLDRTLAWTAAELERGWGVAPPAELPESARNLAAGVLWLVAGDAGQRALAADAFGRSAARAAAGTAWMAPFLGVALDDPYSAVRYIAARSLRSLPGWENLVYDYVAPAPELARAARDALARFTGAPGAPREVLIDATGALDHSRLRALQQTRDDRKVDLRE